MPFFIPFYLYNHKMRKQSKYIFLLVITIICSGCITNKFNYPDTGNSMVSEMTIAKGEFSVKMSPVEGSNALKLEKTYSGDLEAVATGEMLATRSKVQGSASYVAIETVVGTLSGKSGSFALVHRGVMQGENKELLVTISPDSGTKELEGISGSLEIVITEGKHFYVLEYQLPE